jgi:hypothetical protein
LSALRHLEFEFGAQSTQSGMQVERNSLLFLLKYPFADLRGLLVGGARRGLNRVPFTGFGNTSVLLKRYYPISPWLSVLRRERFCRRRARHWGKCIPIIWLS